MRSLFGVSLFSLFVDHRACICIGDRCIDRLALGLARGAAGLIQTVSQSVSTSLRRSLLQYLALVLLGHIGCMYRQSLHHDVV